MAKAHRRIYMNVTPTKSIDTGSSWSGSFADPFNLNGERGLSTFDTRNCFVASYT